MSDASVRTVVLLVNLGTPAAPTPAAIRSFLRQFLSDRRVVDVPRPIWLPILYAFILPFRPGRLAHEYKSIWMGDESPLQHHSRVLREEVKDYVDAKRAGVAVHVAMRYDHVSSVPLVLAKAHQVYPNFDRLVVLPLFPQYTSATTACIFDEVFRFYSNVHHRRVPAIHLIRDYAEEPQYIEAVGETILSALEEFVVSRGAAFAGKRPERMKMGGLLKGFGDDLVVVLSYHSIPVRYQADGDDYADRCTCTTAAVTAFLSKQLGHDMGAQVIQVFQSRFGKEPWLEPFFDDTVKTLPLVADTQENMRKKEEFARKLGRPEFATRTARVCITATPGFAADCLETVHEVKEEGGSDFMEHGGTYFAFVPCLNGSLAHARALTAVVEKYL